MSTLTSAPAVVTDEHIVVAPSVIDPVVVSFDEQYVWSFAPRRDGARCRLGWRVHWPAAISALLDGTTRVRLADAEGAQVHFEGAVSFRGSAAPLRLTDAKGHPLAVDRRAT